MNENSQLNDDLAYVAAAVRNECPPEVKSLYVLWAVLIGIGFSLPDFAPGWTGWYWLVAGIGGGLASWLIGGRSSEAFGMRDSRMGKRYGLHWLAAGVAFLLVALPAFLGRIDGATMGANMLVIAGLVYVLAGIHLNRPMVYGGVLMWAGYILLQTISFPYVWTMTGLTVAAALLVSAFAPSRG